MLRVASVVVAVWLLMATAMVAAASAPWLESYPEQRSDGCTWYTARWQDGSYSGVPWVCPAGASTLRDGVRVDRAAAYPELAAEGCIWYVVRWADGVYTRAPHQCPDGIVLSRRRGRSPSGRSRDRGLPPARIGRCTHRGDDLS